MFSYEALVSFFNSNEGELETMSYQIELHEPLTKGEDVHRVVTALSEMVGTDALLSKPTPLKIVRSHNERFFLFTGEDYDGYPISVMLRLADHPEDVAPTGGAAL